MAVKRTQRVYDHRLLCLVQDTGNVAIATRVGVPRSTAAGWLRRQLPEVTSAPHLDTPSPALDSRRTTHAVAPRVTKRSLATDIRSRKPMEPDWEHPPNRSMNRWSASPRDEKKRYLPRRAQPRSTPRLSCRVLERKRRLVLTRSTAPIQAGNREIGAQASPRFEPPVSGPCEVEAR